MFGPTRVVVQSHLLYLSLIPAECGDYNNEEYPNQNYVSKFKLIPQQDDEFEIKVMENHKKLMYEKLSLVLYRALLTHLLL